MEEDSRVMPLIPLTCDVSLGFKCAGKRGERENSQWSCKSQEDTEGFDTKRE